MDEVYFHSAQKLDNLQMHLSMMAADTKNILGQFTDQGKAHISKIWHNNVLEEVRASLREIWIKLLNRSAVVHKRMAQFQIVFYEDFIKMLTKKWTKQNIYFGAVGFVVGGIVGVAVGWIIFNRSSFAREMLAIRCIRYTGINAVKVTDAEEPYHCDTKEVIVQVRSGSVNVVDAKICEGYGRNIRKNFCKYFKHANYELPVTLGRDCVGIITEVGLDVTRFDLGDEVWLSTPFWAPGVLSETVVVDEHMVGHKPQNVNYENAASLPYAGCVALAAIEEANIVNLDAKEKRVLVVGGYTAVGYLLSQILKLCKAHVTIIYFEGYIPTEKLLHVDQSIVISLKNRGTINYSSNKAQEMILKRLQLEDPFDVIFQTHSCEIAKEDLYRYCRNGGTVVSTLPRVLNSDSYGFFMGPIFSIYLRTKCFFQSFSQYQTDDFGEFDMCFRKLDKLKELVENRNLQTFVDKVYYPRSVKAALKSVVSLETRGATVICFS